MIEKKKLSRNFKSKLKGRAKNDDSICVSAFDFQKTLLAPASNSSSFYYSMRLRLYHFTVTNISCLKNVHCFLWSEDEARKGANDVATSLLLFLKDAKEAGVRDVFLFCDRCAGQNCN